MNEKRNYFRVNEQVLLDYRIVDAYTSEHAEPSLQFEDNGVLQLFSQMHELDKEAQQLLHSIGETNRALADYLAVLNKKFDLISQQFVAQNVSDQQHKTSAVNLSEGGISFSAEKALYKDTYLALRLIFLPSYTGISCFAKVVRCESGDSHNRVAAKFVYMSDATEQLLARQIMQIQRQAKRSANDD